MACPISTRPSTATKENYGIATRAQPVDKICLDGSGKRRFLDGSDRGAIGRDFVTNDHPGSNRLQPREAAAFCRSGSTIRLGKPLGNSLDFAPQVVYTTSLPTGAAKAPWRTLTR